jgi:hypothetical protein
VLLSLLLRRRLQGIADGKVPALGAVPCLLVGPALLMRGCTTGLSAGGGGGSRLSAALLNQDGTGMLTGVRDDQASYKPARLL